jgi:outer membrane protein TolC
VKAAALEGEKAALSVVKGRSTVERELWEVYLRLTEAKEREEAAYFLQATAARAVELAQTSFAAGLITPLALTEALAKHDEARIGFENSAYEYFAAYYDWESAIGQ